MSAKIFDGFRVANRPYHGLVSLLMDWHKTAEQSASIRFSRAIARKAISVIDNRALGRLGKRAESDEGDPLEGMSEPKIFERTWWNLQSAIVGQRKKDARNVEFDYDCSIAVAPLDEHWLLGNIYAEDAVYRHILLRNPAFEDYGYWNNVDRPDELGKAAWKKREKDWDRVLKVSDVLAQNGMFHDLFVGYDAPEVTLPRLAAAIPTFDARVTAKAREIVSERHAARLREPDDRFTHEDPERHNWYLLMDEIKVYLKSEAGEQSVGDESARVSGVLTPVIEMPKDDALMFRVNAIRGDDPSIATYEDLFGKPLDEICED